jgi:hypothetical protein
MLSLVNIEISEDQYFYYHKLKASQELRFGKIFVSSSTTETYTYSIYKLLAVFEYKLIFRRLIEFVA